MILAATSMTMMEKVVLFGVLGLVIFGAFMGRGGKGNGGGSSSGGSSSGAA